jgi:hypothetical protein
MLPYSDPTYRFWLTIYSFPALVPLVINVGFIVFVADDLPTALGVQGAILKAKISIALGSAFMVLIICAHLLAWWHSRTRKPLIPVHEPTVTER